jgi:DNA-binding NtrC family response regulator
MNPVHPSDSDISVHGAARSVSQPPKPLGQSTVPAVRELLSSLAGSQRCCVLVVDHETSVRRSVARDLMACDIEALTAEDAESALRLLETGRVDVMLLDLTMPATAAIHLLNSARRGHPTLPIIAITGVADTDAALRAMRGGAYDFIVKPWPCSETVLIAVVKAIEHRRLLDRTRTLEQRVGDHQASVEWIGSSATLHHAHRLALSVASATTPVLISGESGTGKRLLASIIHQHSPRAHGPLLSIQCNALPSERLRRELFGDETAAGRPGLIEACHGGTLVLGEVGSLPVPLQVELLALLQTGRVGAISEDAAAPPDVRVVATTESDLSASVEAGTFRRDLYYALAVVTLVLPALRTRKEDVAALAHHFMHSHAKRLGREVRRISADAVRCLREQSWVGNVRELGSVIEHAVVVCRGQTILPADLPFERAAREVSAAGSPAAHSTVEGFTLPAELGELPFAEAKKRAVLAFEQEYLRRMLRQAGGNISEAARQSGLDRSNFRRVLKKNVRRRSG